MQLERTATTANIVDVLDRVLDKGIVIDAWVSVSLVGIELVTVQARVVVASIGTYLDAAGALAELKPIAAVAPRSVAADRDSASRAAPGAAPLETPSSPLRLPRSRPA
jgi:gas vesicle structural protein